MFPIAPIIGFATGPLGRALLGAAAAVSVGFASAELYEHKVPWGLSHKLAGARSAEAKAKESQRKAEGAAKLWAQAYRTEKAAVTLQNTRIEQMASTAQAWQQHAQAATAEAHRANLKAQASAAAFLRFKPQGATVAERDHQVADRIREELR
jgi:hypothetical protein